MSTERRCPVCGMPIGRRNGKYCSRECYRISRQPSTPTNDTHLADDSYAHAVRAIAALDEEQRETLKLAFERAWGTAF